MKLDKHVCMCRLMWSRCLHLTLLSDYLSEYFPSLMRWMKEDDRFQDSSFTGAQPFRCVIALPGTFVQDIIETEPRLLGGVCPPRPFFKKKCSSHHRHRNTAMFIYDAWRNIALALSVRSLTRSSFGLVVLFHQAAICSLISMQINLTPNPVMSTCAQGSHSFAFAVLKLYTEVEDREHLTCSPSRLRICEASRMNLICLFHSSFNPSIPLLLNSCP
jgi:hypothetical protein